jgi:hypothetical protein
MHRLLRHAAACLVLAFALGACGKHEAPPANTPARVASAKPAAATSTPAPAPAATPHSPATLPTAPATTASAPSDTHFHVAGVTVGDAVAPDHRVTQAKARFVPTDKVIYAAVETQGITDNATLSATWSYLEGQSRQIVSTSQSIATTGPAVTTFEIRNPNLWPTGKYQVVIALDGKTVATRDFDVTKS